MFFLKGMHIYQTDTPYIIPSFYARANVGDNNDDENNKKQLVSPLYERSTMNCRKHGMAVLSKVLMVSGFDMRFIKPYLKHITNIQKVLCKISGVLPWNTVEEISGFVYVERPYYPENLLNFMNGIGDQLEINWMGMAKKIVDIVADLHKNNIYHGCLSPNNILLDKFNNPWVSDIAMYIKPAMLSKNLASDLIYMFYSKDVQNVYIAPERITRNSKGILIYTEEILLTEQYYLRNNGHIGLEPSMDIFSLGCLITEMVSEGHTPAFPSIKELIAYNGKYRKIPALRKIQHWGIRSLVESMISYHSQDRPTITTCQQEMNRAFSRICSVFRELPFLGLPMNIMIIRLGEIARQLCNYPESMVGFEWRELIEFGAALAPEASENELELLLEFNDFIVHKITPDVGIIRIVGLQLAVISLKSGKPKRYPSTKLRILAMKKLSNTLGNEHWKEYVISGRAKRILVARVLQKLKVGFMEGSILFKIYCLSLLPKCYVDIMALLRIDYEDQKQINMMTLAMPIIDILRWSLNSYCEQIRIKAIETTMKFLESHSVSPNGISLINMLLVRIYDPCMDVIGMIFDCIPIYYNSKSPYYSMVTLQRVLEVAVDHLCIEIALYNEKIAASAIQFIGFYLSVTEDMDTSQKEHIRCLVAFYLNYPNDFIRLHARRLARKMNRNDEKICVIPYTVLRLFLESGHVTNNGISSIRDLFDTDDGDMRHETRLLKEMLLEKGLVKEHVEIIAGVEPLMRRWRARNNYPICPSIRTSLRNARKTRLPSLENHIYGQIDGTAIDNENDTENESDISEVASGGTQNTSSSPIDILANLNAQNNYINRKLQRLIELYQESLQRFELYKIVFKHAEMMDRKQKVRELSRVPALIAASEIGLITIGVNIDPKEKKSNLFLISPHNDQFLCTIPEVIISIKIMGSTQIVLISTKNGKLDAYYLKCSEVWRDGELRNLVFTEMVYIETVIDNVIYGTSDNILIFDVLCAVDRIVISGITNNGELFINEEIWSMPMPKSRMLNKPLRDIPVEFNKAVQIAILSNHIVVILGNRLICISIKNGTEINRLVLEESSMCFEVVEPARHSMIKIGTNIYRVSSGGIQRTERPPISLASISSLDISGPDFYKKLYCEIPSPYNINIPTKRNVKWHCFQLQEKAIFYKIMVSKHNNEYTVYY